VAIDHAPQPGKGDWSPDSTPAKGYVQASQGNSFGGIALGLDSYQNRLLSLKPADGRLSSGLVREELLMSAVAGCRVFCCATLLLLLEVNVSSAQSKDVAFPTLPTGAGAIAKDAPKQLTQTASGLRYRVLRAGKGQMPKATDKVKVNYHGWLDGGKVFDSSYDRKQPISFPLNRVIKGWTEGMQLVGEGGMIELEIPSALGYGDDGAGPIPGGATLHFLVELLKIE
jgi:FKBP-type peptidyl-prolyl cis-trans isomerase FkpA